MAFADAIALANSPKAFGIIFTLYNYTTVDTLTLYVTDSLEFAPSWQGVVSEMDAVDYELRFGTPTVSITEFNFTLHNKRLQHAGSVTHDTISDLLAAGYTWEGRTVTLYLLVKDPASGTIYSSSIYQGRFTNGGGDESAFTFKTTHATLWKLDQVFPDTNILRVTYADAPDYVIGSPIPYVFGDWSVAKVRAEQDNDWNRYAEQAGLADLTRLVPLICTDLNSDDIDTGPVFHAAIHALKEYDVAYSADTFIRVGEKMCPFATATVALANTPPAYVTFDPAAHIKFAVNPIEKGVNTNFSNPVRAIDGVATTYASDSGIADGVLSFVMERPPDHGGLQNAWVFACCTHKLDTTHNEQLRLGLWDSDAAAWAGEFANEYSDTTGDNTKVDRVWLYHDISDAYYANDFPDNYEIRIEHINRQDGNYIYCYHICLLLTYVPHGPLAGTYTPVSAWRDPNASRYYDTRRRPWDSGTPGSGPGWIPAEQYPEITSDGSNIFAACQGVADDGSGTYTGVASALLELPVSIAHYLAADAGATVATGAHGSVRTVPTDQTTDSLVSAMSITSHTKYGDLIAALCRQSLMGMLIRPANYNVGFVYWNSAASDNLYGTAIDFADVLDDHETWVGKTPAGDVRNVFYVQGDYNPVSGRNEATAFCDKDTSDDGAGNDNYGSKSTLSTSQTRYGRRVFHINAQYMRLSCLATVRDEYASMLNAQRVAVRFSLPWKYYNIQPGQVIELDSDSWVAAGHKYPGATGGTDGAWSAGGTTRYLWVERVTFDPSGYIEIEASEGVW